MNTKINEIEKKIPVTSNLVTTTVVNTKINEVENKTPDHSNYITTQEFNKITADSFTGRLKQTNLMNKTDFDNKPTGFNKQNTSEKVKILIKED